MFPTFVGMNRPMNLPSAADVYVPHIRGDEPLVARGDCSCLGCSPHSWG